MYKHALSILFLDTFLGVSVYYIIFRVYLTQIWNKESSINLVSKWMHSPVYMHLHKMYYVCMLNSQLVGNLRCAIYIK